MTATATAIVFEERAGGAGPVNGLNPGIVTAPALTARTGDANPFNNFTGDSPAHVYTRPALAGLNADGGPGLAAGNRSRPFEYYEGVEVVETERPRSPLTWREAAVSPFSGIAVNGNSMPAFADLDSAGDLGPVMGIGGDDRRVAPAPVCPPLGLPPPPLSKY